MVHASPLLLGCGREPREPGRLIVKRTFFELVDGNTEASLFRRACSDPAIFDSAAQQSQSPGGAQDDAESEAGDLDFHLNGLSDAETSSDVPEGGNVAAAASSDRLSSGAPRSESGRSGVPSEFSAEELSREDAASDHTEADLRAGALPPCHIDIQALMSENLRLQMENHRLRESARHTWGEGDAADQRAQCHLAMPLHEGAGSMWCFLPAMLPGSAAQAQPATTSPSAAGALAGCTGEEPTMDVDGRTTVMLRNLPNNYSRAMVLAMLDSEGFAGLYDFLYLPIDFNSQACLGYAFVNLTDPSLVPAFWNTFNGFSNWILPSRKVCRVSWSGPHQGLEEHVARYRNSPVMHSCVPDEFKPVIFINGVRVPFPESTKAPRAPRIRHHVGFKSRSSWSSRLATGQGQ